MPDISVLLPVYNGSEYLRESIQSVLNQAYFNFRFIIVDDCSNDDSREIIKSFSDGRIITRYNNINKGLFKTLNDEIKGCETDWVMLWSQDDIMLPAALNEFSEFIKTNPKVGMVYSNFYSINEFGIRTNLEDNHLPQRRRTPHVASQDISALLFFYFGCLPGNISTVMLNKKAWQTVGGFVEGMTQAPDYEMWVRISAKHLIGYINQKLIELRNHDNQQSRVGQREMQSIKEDFFVYQKLLIRLVGILKKSEIENYFLSHRGIQHVQWIFNAFIKGNFKSALQGIKYLSEYGKLYKQFLYWLFSFNGRFFIKKNYFYYDKTIKKLAI